MKEEEWVIVHTAVFPRPRYNKVQLARDHTMDSIVLRISCQDIIIGRSDYQSYSNEVDSWIGDVLGRIEKQNGRSLEAACDEIVEALK